MYKFDIAVRVVLRQEQQLRDHRVGDVIIDRRADEDECDPCSSRE